MKNKTFLGVLAGACVAGIALLFFLSDDANNREGDVFSACANAEIPDVSLDTVLNEENGTVEVFWSDPKTSENKSVILPYNPKEIYEKCSDSAKRVLKHVSNTNSTDLQ